MGNTILIVDDEPRNIKLMSAHLLGSGYRVIGAVSGAEALAKVASERPDLILLDVMMPDLDGMEVLRRLKAADHSRDIPVVLVTALDSLEHRIRGLEAGADEFLSKPVNRQELMARVRSLLRLVRSQNELDERIAQTRQLLADDQAGRVPDTILVVEDDLRLQRQISTVLSSAGYRVSVAGTALEAAVILGRDAPGMIILDIMLPDKDGLEFLREIKRHAEWSISPVIIVTATTELERKVEGLDRGADDYLVKPVSSSELLARVRTCLRRAGVQKRLTQFNDLVVTRNRSLEDEVRQRTVDLYDTQLEIVRSLGRAAEYRDHETGDHILRMSRYCAALARAVGLDETQAELLLHASPMHDIGKVGIPDHILRKQGPLDDEEWKIMQMHTTIGHNILKAHHSSELIEMARRVALSHHERWDGSGYPQGLAGEAIPIEARIVALADVFDALTSERPYKSAWPLEDALVEIRRLRGINFDPRLVDIFVEMTDEIEYIRRTCREEIPGESAQDQD